MSVPEVYAGKNVFITGGSGFIGKVLIEKLLRSCPDVGNIYILLRSKKGKSYNERVEQITEDKLFDTLRKQRPEDLKKITALEGDTSCLNLGLKESDQLLLINRVNFIFHCAAYVRFDQSLRDAILTNVRGIKEVIGIAKRMRNLLVLVHVSTTYAHINNKETKEVITPSKFSWMEAIELAENYDNNVLDILTMKYLGSYPNTYTFTKNMAEGLVNDLCNNQIPAVICRPSIIISTANDPVMGWIDNFNGPVGLIIASASGLLRTKYVDFDVKADFLPVDILIKMLLIVAWDKAIQKSDQKLTLEVFNCSNNAIQDVSVREMEEIAVSQMESVPLQRLLWYPKIKNSTNNYYVFYLQTIFYHLFFALLVDFLLKLTKNKPFLTKLYRRIYIANTAIYFFISKEWKFDNKRTLGLVDKLSEKDFKDFGYDINAPLLDPKVFLRNGCLGCKKYLLKETASLEECQRNLFRMWIISIIFKFFLYSCLSWILFYKLELIQFICRKFDILS